MLCAVAKMVVSYCMASHAADAHAQKPTNLWSGHGDFVETFVRQARVCLFWLHCIPTTAHE